MKNKYIQPTVDFCAIMPEEDILVMSVNSLGYDDVDAQKNEINISEFF